MPLIFLNPFLIEVMMSELSCPFCSSELKRPEVDIGRFWLCPQCKTTVLGSGEFLNLNRKLFAKSRIAWSEYLKTQNDPSDPQHPCPFHNTPLHYRKTPSYGHSSWQADCCDLVFLRPSEMTPILDLSSNTDIAFTRSYEVKKGFNPLGFIGKWIASFQAKQEVDPFADLEDIHWRKKIAPCLHINAEISEKSF